MDTKMVFEYLNMESLSSTNAPNVTSLTLFPERFFYLSNSVALSRTNPNSEKNGLSNEPSFQTVFVKNDDDLLQRANIIGTSGDDRLEGTNGDDTIQGDLGNDTIFGLSGNDYIYGNDGDDLIFGGDGNDGIQGDAGSDTVYGGDGNDSIFNVIGDNPLGNEQLFGEAGNDSLYISGIGNQIIVADCGSGDDNLRLDFDFVSFANKTLKGGDGEDRLHLAIGRNNANGVLQGWAIDLAAFEKLGYWSGFELIIIETTVGSDLILGTEREDWMFAYSEDARGNISTGGRDVFRGRGGGDNLNATAESLANIGEYDGGEGYDTFRLDALRSKNGLRVDLRDLNLISVERALCVGSNEFADEIFGANFANQIFGLGGNDTIIGGIGSNELSGGDGRDSLFGGTETDYIFGGDYERNAGVQSSVDDSDLIDSGAGSDEIWGGAGRDTIYGGSGNDMIYGGLGSDWLYGDDGDDQIFAVMDSVQSEGAGSIPENRLFGGNGNDTLTGSTNEDILEGGSGNDLLVSGPIDETRDLLTGGVGRDRFVVSKGDWITDLSSNDEFIVFNAPGSSNLSINRSLFSHDRFIATSSNGSVSTSFRFSQASDTSFTADLNSSGQWEIKIFDRGEIERIQQAFGRALFAEQSRLNGYFDALIGNQISDAVVGGITERAFERAGRSLTDPIQKAAWKNFTDGRHLGLISSIFGLRTLESDRRRGVYSSNPEGYWQEISAIIVGVVLTVRSIGFLSGTVAVLTAQGFAAAIQSLTAVTLSALVQAGSLIQEASSGTQPLNKVSEDSDIVRPGFNTGGQTFEPVQSGGGNDFIILSRQNGPVQGNVDSSFARNAGGVTSALDGGSGWDVVEFQNMVANALISIANDRTISGGGYEVSLNGVEEIVLSDERQVVTINQANLTIQLGGGNNEATANVAGAIYSGNGNDQIFAFSGAQYISTGGGRDTVIGGDGTDSLDGGADLDTLSYEFSKSGTIVSFGGVSANTGGDAEGDIVVNFENLIGSAYADNLEGSVDGNLIQGKNGNDTIRGGAGLDTLVGGNGADILDGGDGFDFATYANATTGLTLFMGGGTFNSGEANGDTHTSIEGLIGSNFSDIIGGDAGINDLRGLNGNDFIYGRGGTDTLLGGDGNDVLAGGLDGDRLEGGTGIDVAFYRDATTGITASLLTGGGTGEAAGDTYLDIENIWGSDFDDVLSGDNLAGQVYGFAGNDRLSGLDGEDYFYGGQGFDTLTGGAGVDNFFFLSWNDHFNQFGTLEPYEGGDTFTDFTSGTDKIILSRYWFGFGNIDGPAAALTETHANFVTNGAVTTGRPSLIWNNANRTLSFDADGNGATQAVLLGTFQAGATLALGDIWTA
jgi:Ca2+-binding RTX toxin-like protein